MNSTSGNGPIKPEVVVACGIRHMAGEKIKYLANIFSVSHSSADRIIKRFLEAVDECEEFDSALPETNEALEQLAKEWAGRSSTIGLFDGYLGSIVLLEKQKDWE